MHSPHSATLARARKGPAAQPAEKTRRPCLSPLLRRTIEARVMELHAEDCREEYSRVLAREFSISEELADWILAGLMLEHRTAAATLRTGIAGAMDEEERARKEIWNAA